MKPWLIGLLAFSATCVYAQTDVPYYPRSTTANQDMGGVNANFIELATTRTSRNTTQITPENCPPGTALAGAYYNNGATTGGQCVAVSTSATTVYNVGPAGAQGIQGPPGSTGAAGAAATIAVGTTLTVSSMTPAAVSNSGTTSAAIFNFSIPQGHDGQAGPIGPIGPGATYPYNYWLLNSLDNLTTWLVSIDIDGALRSTQQPLTVPEIVTIAIKDSNLVVWNMTIDDDGALRTERQ